MADKAKEPKEEEVEGGEKKKSGNMLLIIIIVVLVLILVIGGVVVAMMSGNSEAEATAGAKKETSAHGDSKEEAAKEAPAAEGDHAAEGGTEAGLMFPLETFTVNLLSESGRRYLKVEMTLEMEGEELSPELEEKKPIFRDIIIRQLSSKSLEEISTLQGKEKLKEGIVAELNTRLHDGKVKGIYFTDFVVQ